MFILTSLFFYCSTAKADDCDSNVIELYDYETGQTSNISISDYSINFLQKSGGKAHGFNRGMKAKKLFAIIGQ